RFGRCVGVVAEDERGAPAPLEVEDGLAVDDRDERAALPRRAVATLPHFRPVEGGAERVRGVGGGEGDGLAAGGAAKAVDRGGRGELRSALPVDEVAASHAPGLLEARE